MATHFLPTRIEDLGQGDKFTVNTPVPNSSCLQSQLYIWYGSQECRIKQLHWEQAFLHISCLLKWGFLPGFTISGRGHVSVLTDFPPSLLRADLQLYLLQVSALGSCSISPFWQDISFAFSTNPSPPETVEVVSGCCWAKQTCQERKLLCWCITGSHTVCPKRYCVWGAKSK